MSGTAECEAFERLAKERVSTAATERLCHIVLMELLPALAEKDFLAFGKALFQFNHAAGLLFAPIQGGPYSSERITQAVRAIYNQGISGVGQSSWGPCIFAVTDSDSSAQELMRMVRSRFDLREHEVLVLRARNHPAQVGILHDQQSKPGVSPQNAS
jgi:beta-RFAP synthase